MSSTNWPYWLMLTMVVALGWTGHMDIGWVILGMALHSLSLRWGK